MSLEIAVFRSERILPRVNSIYRIKRLFRLILPYLVFSCNTSRYYCSRRVYRRISGMDEAEITKWVALSRTAEGRATLTVEVVSSRWHLSVDGKEKRGLLLVLRNACAQLSHAEELVRGRGCGLLRQRFAAEEGEDGDDDVPMLCQLISNVAAHSSVSICTELWREGEGTMLLFSFMMAASARTRNKSRLAFAASLSAIYNTLMTLDFPALDNLCANRQLLCQILLQSVQTAAEKEDPSREWLLLIFSKCVCEGRLEQIFSLLQSSLDGLGYEQVILLKILQALLEEGQCPLEQVWGLLHSLPLIAANQQETQDEAEAHLAETAVLGIVSVLGAALVVEGEAVEALQSSLATTTRTMEMSIGLLSSSSAATMEGRNEIIKGALALAGNLCHRCPAAQDAFRELGGFQAVLPRCATSFRNPFEREWALMCVRNACEGCLVNQQFIEALQPQGARVLDEMAGVGVEINGATGTFRFVSTAPPKEEEEEEEE